MNSSLLKTYNQESNFPRVSIESTFLHFKFRISDQSISMVNNEKHVPYYEKELIN